MHGILTLIMVIFLVNQAVAGTWTGHKFIYKPSLGARGATEKNTFDSGLDRVDAHLGKYKTLGNPGYETLASALTTIGSTEVTLTVPVGSVSITGNTTIPANVHLRMLRGGKFDISNAVSLTINGPFEAGPYQVFSWTGTGKVEFGGGAVAEVFPEWWGAKADSSTDSTTAIQAAINTVSSGIVKLQRGTYLISTPLKHKASLIGVGENASGGVPGTKIAASASWSGDMMLDFYNSPSYYYGLRVEDIFFDADGKVSYIFGSSNDGIGNSKGFHKNIRFADANDCAIYARTMSTNLPGMLTGSTFINCLWTGSSGGAANIGNNQDDVQFISCRVEAISGTMPLVFGGQNFTWNGGFISFTNLYNEGGTKALIRITTARTIAFRNLFLETNGSDFTHVFHFTSPQCNALLENIHLRVDNAGQSPSLIALVRAYVEQWADTRYPRVMLKNIYADYDSPDWKLLDLYVGANSGSNDYFALNIEGCDGFAAPFFQWASGSSTVGRDTVYISGTHRGARWNHSFRQDLGVNNARNQRAFQDQVGLVSYNNYVDSASGLSPRSGSITLPSQGIWLVSVSAYNWNANRSHMAHGLWKVIFSDYDNDLLDSEQLGTTKVTGNASILTLSNPTTGGVCTATAAWTGGGSYVTRFIFRCKKLSGVDYYGDY